MSDILKDNLDIVREEIFNDPSSVNKHSMEALVTIYDNSNEEDQAHLLKCVRVGMYTLE